LLLPPQGDGPFPLLLDFHGGPQSVAQIDFSSHVYWYELCSKGWAVLAPNAVGSSGYGQACAERLNGRYGELDLPQHLSIIDTLQSEGLADDRIACTGKSYGGFLTAWAIGRTSRFKAAVISAPITNHESHFGTSDTGFYVTPYGMGGEPADMQERYDRLAPIHHAHEVTTPTLLLQGDDDQRCPLGQTEEMFAALVRRSDAPCTMVVYPGGSHALASTGKPSHRVDYHRRIVRWLERWVAKA
jgi:dipeptidyl aminopeptidase/acylaminoacyl peptidase